MGIDWDARIAAATAARDAAKASVTPELAAEKEARAKEAALLDEARSYSNEVRDVDIARRLDATREALGPDIPLDSYAHAELPDSFIVRSPTEPDYKRWEKAIQNSQQKKRSGSDLSDAGTELALACIYDWNGETDLHGIASKKGGALLAWAQANGPAMSAIFNLAQELGGFRREARKS